MQDQQLIVHKDVHALKSEDQELLRRAAEFLKQAYAPYSHFYVGAAIITRAGNIVGGANQENASYPLCMCGERVALYNCTIQHPGEVIDTIAIVVNGKNAQVSPAPPCGACLQVLREFESRQDGSPIRLLLKANHDTVWEVPSVKVMLPYSFDGSFLE